MGPIGTVNKAKIKILFRNILLMECFISFHAKLNVNVGVKNTWVEF